MHLRGRAPVRRALILSILSVATVLVVVGPASAERDGEALEAEQHCVAAVTSQAADGELTLSEPNCYGSFAEAMADLSAGAVKLDAATEGSAVFNDELVGTLAASFTLGIHFNKNNGGGSSISITGTSCSGGYWNATGWWRNRINSSFNGCYHLRHYDNPGKSGSSFNTYGGGQIDNLGWFKNRTESVAYYSW